MTSIALKPTNTPRADSERAAILEDPGFGRYFTDHMVSIRWDEGQGWHDGQLVPYASFELDPAVMVLHYGQAIFEGLKAYRQPDGSVATFRADANARRFQRSAARLAMPALPEELFLESISVLVTQDAAWVPSGAEHSLYLRPFMFSIEVGLGVRPAASYQYLLIASPAGAYFPRGVKPVSVWLSEDYVRAAPGGTGEAKFAGNYAASLVAQRQAAERGCDQVVWLDAKEHRYVEEMGGMNLCFVHGSGDDVRLVTPALSGALLEGVTRDSLLTIAGDLGYATEERLVSTEEWQQGNATGSISEVFACGTAAVITPVGEVMAEGRSWTVGDGGTGPVTARLGVELLGIQTGDRPDRHGWMHTVVAAP
jgi:branched-chain amino acid aminotransferase